MLDWVYEQRRNAQQILPFLYLGPMSAARDRDFLLREGITMVLAVRNTMSAQAKLLGSRAAQDLGIATRMVDVAGNQELIAAFPRAIEVINAHLTAMYQHEQLRITQGGSSTQGHLPTAPGKVLVFCESGNERSATLVTAYIMAMYSTDLIKAIQIVQAQRFAVAFDDSLRNLLSTYEIILRAKRDVVQADSHFAGLRDRLGGREQNGCGNERFGKSSKRTLDDAYEEEMDMDEEDQNLDYGRFERRGGSAPFQDRPVV